MPGLKRNAFHFHKICAVILSTSLTNLSNSLIPIIPDDNFQNYPFKTHYLYHIYLHQFSLQTFSLFYIKILKPSYLNQNKQDTSNNLFKKRNINFTEQFNHHTTYHNYPFKIQYLYHTNFHFKRSHYITHVFYIKILKPRNKQDT